MASHQVPEWRDPCAAEAKGKGRGKKRKVPPTTSPFFSTPPSQWVPEIAPENFVSCVYLVEVLFEGKDPTFPYKKMFMGVHDGLISALIAHYRDFKPAMCIYVGELRGPTTQGADIMREMTVSHIKELGRTVHNGSVWKTEILPRSVFGHFKRDMVRLVRSKLQIAWVGEDYKDAKQGDLDNGRIDPSEADDAADDRVVDWLTTPVRAVYDFVKARVDFEPLTRTTLSLPEIRSACAQWVLSNRGFYIFDKRVFKGIKEAERAIESAFLEIGNREPRHFLGQRARGFLDVAFHPSCNKA